MIKVFTTDKGPRYAGDELTRQFETWMASFATDVIEIISFHTNSNKFGWCLTVHYKIIK
jgi:hypothetical protein